MQPSRTEYYGQHVMTTIFTTSHISPEKSLNSYENSNLVLCFSHLIICHFCGSVQKNQDTLTKYFFTSSCSLQSYGVWKSQKKSHSTLRAKRATFTFWDDKVNQKWSNLASFRKPITCGQTVSPDKSNETFLGDFQTTWVVWRLLWMGHKPLFKNYYSRSFFLTFFINS